MKKINISLDDVCIPTKIIERGRSYYQNNRILDAFWSDGEVIAYTDGTEIYRSTILLNEAGSIIGATCTCPYGVSGDYCKHIAAVLCMIERRGELPVLETFQAEDMVSFEFSALKVEVNRIIKSLSRPHGFIDYYNGAGFVRMINKVANDIQKLIQKRDYNDAFEIVKFIYKKIATVNMDGSNGEFQESFEIINQAALLVLQDEPTKKLFYKYTADTLKGGKLGDFSDAPLAVLLRDVKNKEDAKKIIQIMDENFNSQDFFVNSRTTKFYLLAEYFSDAEALEYAENIPSDDFEIQKALANFYEKRQDLDKAEAILKQDLNELRAVRWHWYVDLYEFYVRNNMVDKLNDLLENAIIKTGELEPYNILRGLVDGDRWQEVYYRIVKKLKENKQFYLLFDIFCAEDDAEELNNLFKKQKFSLSYISEASKILVKKFPDTIMDAYIRELIEEIQSFGYNSNRTKYREIAGYFKKLQKIPNSDSAIQHILTTTLSDYIKRSACKEEFAAVLNKGNREFFEKLLSR